MQLCDNEIDIDPTVCIKNKIKAFISWVNMHMEYYLRFNSAELSCHKLASSSESRPREPKKIYAKTVICILFIAQMSQTA